MDDWKSLLSSQERLALDRAGWGRSTGLGQRPALLVIDVQNYMVGEPEAPDNLERYPFSCGAAGAAALVHIAAVLGAARKAGLPVIYTRFVIDPDLDDGSLLHHKVAVGRDRSDNLYFRDTHGAEIVDKVAPRPGEPVIDKNRRSAFFGTPLLKLLSERGVDSCIIVGGSTSGCIRPTVCDAEQNNLRVILPQEAVFDRFQQSHAVNLFDMHRSQADVVASETVTRWLSQWGGAGATGWREAAND